MKLHVKYNKHFNVIVNFKISLQSLGMDELG